jgi:hypothetical protein
MGYFGFGGCLSVGALASCLRQIGSSSGASSVCATLGLDVVQADRWIPLSVLWWPGFGSLDLGSETLWNDCWVFCFSWVCIFGFFYRCGIFPVHFVVTIPRGLVASSRPSRVSYFLLSLPMIRECFMHL